jgi:hypothetical protein
MRYDRPLGLSGRLIASILILLIGVFPAYLGGELLWSILFEHVADSMGAAVFISLCFLVMFLFAYIAWRVAVNRPFRKDGGLFPPVVIMPFAYFWTVGGAVAIVKHLYDGDMAGAFHAFEMMAIGVAGLVIVKRRKERSKETSTLPPPQESNQVDEFRSNTTFGGLESDFEK